jgi:DNA-binding NarL/FixJ family response regulator
VDGRLRLQPQARADARFRQLDGGPTGHTAPVLGTRLARVLLVDDHAPLRELMRELLEERGCEVVAEAGDGLEALEALEGLAAIENDCDIVVMDLSMPQLGGIEATQAIVHRHPGVEVVGFTTRDDPLTSAAMLEAGATRHFVKTQYRALVDHVAGWRPRDRAAS